jgi:hypothetical protein
LTSFFDSDLFAARFFGTVAASLAIFVLGAVAGVFSRRFTARRSIRQLLDFPPGEPLNIVIATPMYIDPETDSSTDRPGVPLVTLGTVTAYKKVLTLIRQAYPGTDQVRLFAAGEFPPGLYGEHLVLIGYPDTNPVTRRVLAKLAPPIVFKGHEIVDTASGVSWTARIENGEVVRDFGYITKVKNPFAPHSRILILAGSHTYGMSAAAEYFDPANLLDLSSLSPSRWGRWLYTKLPPLIRQNRRIREYQVVVAADVNRYYTAVPERCAYHAL